MAVGDTLEIATLAEAIAKLAKSIEKSNENTLKALNKITGNTTQTPTSAQQPGLPTDDEDALRKRGKVFEDVLNINVVEFGSKALQQLSKVFKDLVPKEEKRLEPTKKPEESSFFKKLLALSPLLLPLIAGLLKFLAGLSGDKLFELLANLFPKIFNIGKLTEGLMDIVKAVGSLFTKGIDILKSTKLGKFFSELGDGIAKMFKENKLFQKIFGEAGIFSKVFGKAGFFAKMFGEASIFAKLFDTAGDAAKVLTGGFFGKIFKGIGKTVLKRLPIIGSLFSFYDAYNELSSGDYLSGFTSLISGIANLFPGVGSIVSIGLDFINYLFKTESMKDFKANLNQGLFTQAFSSLGDTLVQKMPFLKWFSDLSENIGGALTGDNESIIRLFDQFGLGGFAQWAFGDPKEKAKVYAETSGISQILITIIDNLTKVVDWFLSFFSDSFKQAVNDFATTSKKKILGFIGLDSDDEYNAKAENVKMQEKYDTKKAQQLKERELMLKQQREQNYEKLQDFTVNAENMIKKGNEIKKFSKDDTIIGFKPGGDIDKLLKGVLKSLTTVAKNSEDLIDLGKKQIRLLDEVLQRSNNNIVNTNTNNNTIVMSSRTGVDSFRADALQY